MSSILKVSEIQDPTNGNTALAIDSTGDITTLKAPGTVIQTVTNTSTTTVTVSSTTPVNLIAVSITPKFANSVIHIEYYVSQIEIGKGSSNAYATVYLYDPSGNQLFRTVNGEVDYNSATHSGIGIHSPNSTSSQTYQTMIGTASGGTGTTHTNSGRYTIKATEIAQ